MNNTHVAYHKKLGAKWCSEDEFKKLLKTKRWFDSPTKASANKAPKKESVEVVAEVKADDADQSNS